MKRLVIRLIRFYQRKISPGMAPRCRFVPTCSQYAAQAVEVHGVFKGCLLSLYRVIRCNPLCKGGYDPVPPKKK